MKQLQLQLMQSLDTVPGEIISVTADQLRSMSVEELISFGRGIGVDLSYLKDRASAMYTALVQHAFSLENDA